MISWLLTLHASSQVPYELLALVLINLRESCHIVWPQFQNATSLLLFIVHSYSLQIFITFFVNFLLLTWINAFVNFELNYSDDGRIGISIPLLIHKRQSVNDGKRK